MIGSHRRECHRAGRQWLVAWFRRLAASGPKVWSRMTRIHWIFAFVNLVRGIFRKKKYSTILPDVLPWWMLHQTSLRKQISVASWVDVPTSTQGPVWGSTFYVFFYILHQIAPHPIRTYWIKVQASWDLSRSSFWLHSYSIQEEMHE